MDGIAGLDPDPHRVFIFRPIYPEKFIDLDFFPIHLRDLASSPEIFREFLQEFFEEPPFYKNPPLEERGSQFIHEEIEKFENDEPFPLRGGRFMDRVSDLAS